jgi:hypothetical protein
MTTQEVSGAIFSDCKKYRYVLWRRWDEKPMVALIGLNPSKANSNEDDNTITKVGKVARYNGFGGIYMLNLFAIISADPNVLLTCSDPLKDNDQYLIEYTAGAKDIVFCWGAFKQGIHRAEQIKPLFPNALCFKHTKAGHPWHPLYCKDNTIFIPFNIQK